MILYHGSHNDTTTAHEGMCLTDDEVIADTYACGGTVTEMDLPEWAVIEECAGYDHDTNDAPADSASFRAAAAARGADVLVYADEDERGRSHDCYRLVSARIVAAL